MKLSECNITEAKMFSIAKNKTPLNLSTYLTLFLLNIERKIHYGYFFYSGKGIIIVF